MKKVGDLIKNFENIMLRSRNLNDSDFDKFLCNLELIKKNTIMLKRREKSKLIENVSFRGLLINNL